MGLGGLRSRVVPVRADQLLGHPESIEGGAVDGEQVGRGLGAAATAAAGPAADDAGARCSRDEAAGGDAAGEVPAAGGGDGAALSCQCGPRL